MGPTVCSTAPPTCTRLQHRSGLQHRSSCSSCPSPQVQQCLGRPVYRVQRATPTACTGLAPAATVLKLTNLVYLMEGGLLLLVDEVGHLQADRAVYGPGDT